MSSNRDRTSVFLLVVSVEALSHTIVWTNEVKDFQVSSVTNLIIGHQVFVINLEEDWSHSVFNDHLHSEIPFWGLTCICFDWSACSLSIENDLAIWIHSTECFGVSGDLCFFNV